jgi:phenylacetate-coenzyme A ligase PaaK-like adenylate-forming protein
MRVTPMAPGRPLRSAVAGTAMAAARRLRRDNPLRSAVAAALARTETASADELRRYQERRLRLLVRWAATRAPRYRRILAEAGVDPQEVRGLEDLGRLPLLERRHLLEEAEGFLAVPRRAAWNVTSSGTTGQPVTCYRTPGSVVFELAAKERQWGWFGVPPGARRVVIRGRVAADRGPVAVRQTGANELHLSSAHLEARRLPEIREALEGFGPAMIEGWPSSLALLAGLLRDAGCALAVRAVGVSSEVLTPAQAALLSEVFRAPVVEHYGQRERVAMAGTCEAGGYHVFSDYGIVELLPVPGAHERWEIVGTALHNWGFPLLRYRTGDHVGPAPEGPCPCGRAFPLIGSVQGRSEDAVRAADGRLVPLPHRVLNDLLGVREAQLVQRRPGEFELRMVPGPGFDADELDRRARRNLERVVGPGQRLTTAVVERIPRQPSGKLRPVLVLPDA